jgi:parallel beta-helix repeat protein
MPLTITDFFEQVDGLSTEDVPPELRARIDEELAELTDGITGPQGEPSQGSSPGDPDAVVVDQDGAGDFETIQAALDDPDTDPGDTILIRAGRYAPADPIDVTDPGELRLIGAGQGSDPATNTVIEQAIDVTVNDAAGNGVTLRNLRLSNAGPFDAGGDGADLDAVFDASGPELRDVAVENVAFVGNADEGLEIDDTDQLAVRNCLFENNAGDGINGDRVTNATITGCTIENNGFEGIDLDSVDSLAIEDCTVRGNGGSGVEFDGDAVDLTVTGTTIAENGVAGLTAPENEIADALIEDCTIANNFFGGIEFEAVDGLTIRDSTIEENFDGVNDPQVTDPAGVRALVRDLTVERSRIENNGESFGAGIRLIGNRVESFAVLNSVIAGNAGFGVVVNGFFTGNGAADVTIRNATVRANGNDGLVFRGDANDVTVGQAVVAENDGSGIRFAFNDLTDVTVADSNVRNNAELGVERAAGFFDSGNVAVQGCFFADNDDGLVSDGVDQSGTRTSPVPDAGASL